MVDLGRVDRLVAGVPYMKPEQARVITSKVLDSGACDVLELGIMHGVSTCYLAEALEQSGRDWSITSLDLESALTNRPNVEELLTELGLRERVQVLLEPRSYTWRLRKMLEEDPSPRFDFCYLDGAHTWDADGFAFFLVDRLLRPGGWIVFDDIDWSYAGSPPMMAADWVAALPAEEQQALQVKQVFDLLVRPHPSYGELMVKDGWGHAQKLPPRPTAHPWSSWSWCTSRSGSAPWPTGPTGRRARRCARPAADGTAPVPRGARALWSVELCEKEEIPVEEVAGPADPPSRGDAGQPRELRLKPAALCEPEEESPGLDVV